MSPVSDPTELLLRARRIAVVGLSDQPDRPSHEVARFLLQRGLEVVPVNPRLSRWQGLTAFPSLRDVAGRVDLVNVFRRPELCPDIVRDAVAIAAGGVWLQLGVRSDQAEAIAAAAGLPFVQDRCLMVEMMRR